MGRQPFLQAPGRAYLLRRMRLPLLLYTAALTALRPLLPAVSRGGGKLARGVRGRRDVLRRMEAWATASRDADRPLVWLHAPSVGEGLQARVVIEALRARRPDVQIVYTFFSPSAERFARGVPADFADYLPLDLPSAARRALAALRPAVIAFNKTEVWPNLAAEAKQRAVRLALLSATLPAGSGRLRGIARPLLRPAFAALDRLGAISASDAERFEALGVPAERRVVMGDARFDQVWHRAAAVDRNSPLLAPLRDASRPTLVAGSTWPADEVRLIPALARARREASLRAIVTPHEPTPQHLAGLEEALDRQALRHARLSSLGSSPREWDVLVVDRVGVLGELYALADVAYVGGGFGTAGLHSVLEPAAFGVPILFGPHHSNAREAAELAEAGAAFVAADRLQLEELLGAMLRDGGRHRAAGRAARAYIENGLGGADRGVEILLELLDGRG